MFLWKSTHYEQQVERNTFKFGPFYYQMARVYHKGSTIKILELCNLLRHWLKNTIDLYWHKKTIFKKSYNKKYIQGPILPLISWTKWKEKNKRKNKYDFSLKNIVQHVKVSKQSLLIWHNVIFPTWNTWLHFTTLTSQRLLFWGFGTSLHLYLEDQLYKKV